MSMTGYNSHYLLSGYLTKTNRVVVLNVETLTEYANRLNQSEGCCRTFHFLITDN